MARAQLPFFEESVNEQLYTKGPHTSSLPFIHTADHATEKHQLHAKVSSTAKTFRTFTSEEVVNDYQEIEN